MSQVLSNISKTLSTTGNDMKYSFNSVINPNIYGVPLITFGLIGITSIVLAYVTIAESDDAPSAEKTDIIPESTNPFSNFSNPLGNVSNPLGNVSNPLGNTMGNISNSMGNLSSSISNSLSPPQERAELKPAAYSGGKTKKQKHKNRKTKHKKSKL